MSEIESGGCGVAGDPTKLVVRWDAAGRVFNTMWEAEKRSVAFTAGLWKQRDDARAALLAARQKLQLYRAQHSGEYIGGMEYTALIRLIDEALK